MDWEIVVEVLGSAEGLREREQEIDLTRVVVWLSEEE